MVQQYIQQLIRNDTYNIDLILDPPEGQDEGVRKNEHLRKEYEKERLVLVTSDFSQDRWV